MKEILITGGAGFIGYHLAKKLLLNKNNNITIIDNFESGKNDKFFRDLIKKENVNFVKLNLINLNDMKKRVWKYYDNVYHLAAIVGVKKCMEYPSKVLDVNIKSTFNVEQLMRENRCRKIVFASSCEVYASGFQFGIVPIPTNEEVPVAIKDIFNPRWSYAISKLVGEQLFIFNSLKLYDYSIVRYHNIFGPRQDFSHAIPEIIRRILLKESPLKVYGYNQTRAFCFIEDAINQTISVMDNDSTNEEILNIGNDIEELKIIDLYYKILKIMKYQTKLELIQAPTGSVNRRSPNLEKIKRLTEFPSLTDSFEALENTINWYIENREELN